MDEIKHIRRERGNMFKAKVVSGSCYLDSNFFFSFRVSEVTVVAGRPGLVKTAFAIALALNLTFFAY